jgi:hypothetical protein
MPTKVKRVSPDVTLARVLAALEQELIDATDVEIREAAQDLGMNVDMKGSAAFAGLRYPAKARFSDYFGPDAVARFQGIAKARRREHDDERALPRGERKDGEGEEN